MFDSLINYLDKFGPEVLVIQTGFLVILSTLFLWLWFANRRKYHNLKHAIPANVVKNYLDSIIQNSTALKSSLFRGGGLDLTGVPSVMPLQGMGGGDNLAVSGAPATALMEELNQKKAMIASLESQLLSLQTGNKEFEAKLLQSQNNLTTAEAKIRELEALLAKQRSGDNGGDAAVKAELDMVIKERDEIRDRLREFEIISDDLANLKRLQQENEQLKKSLAAQGGSLPQAAQIAEPSYQQADVADLLEDLSQSDDSGGEDNKALEDFLSSPEDSSPSESIETSEVDNLLAEDGSSNTEDPNEENKTKSEKTPEDLLSEFEKMLG